MNQTNTPHVKMGGKKALNADEQEMSYDVWFNL